MRLVDDERVVLAQQAIVGQLGQQDAVGHQLDHGVAAHLVGEAHLVADQLPQRRAQLLGDPVGDRTGRQPPGLGVADHAAHATAGFETEFGQLGRLAGARLAGDDHDLVLPDGRQQVVAALADRELVRVRDRGDLGFLLREAQLRQLDLGLDLRVRLGGGVGIADLPGTVEATAQPTFVPER